MKDLISFFVKYGIYFFFASLEVYALMEIVNGNYFQRTVFYRYSNELIGRMYWLEGKWTYYWHLEDVNEDLSQENVRLKNEMYILRGRLKAMKSKGDTVIKAPMDPKLSYTCRSARVINNSVHSTQNYITLNRGLKSGIREEMSVISARGVVGIVTTVSDNFAVVMPVLNSRSQISCKIKERVQIIRTDSSGSHIMNKDTIGVIKDIGSLVWNGGDPRYADMMQVPRHVKVHKGDSVVTSGYSDYFPEGILVGTVDKAIPAEDDNFYDIKVKLAVDYNTLTFVQVMDYKHATEQKTTEQKAKAVQLK